MPASAGGLEGRRPSGIFLFPLGAAAKPSHPAETIEILGRLRLPNPHDCVIPLIMHIERLKAL